MANHAHIDPEKTAGPILNNNHIASRRNSESTLEEALDAEANIGPLQDVEVVNGEKNTEPGPPPNGGREAWLQVVGSFFLFFNCW